MTVFRRVLVVTFWVTDYFLSPFILANIPSELVLKTFRDRHEVETGVGTLICLLAQNKKKKVTEIHLLDNEPQDWSRNNGFR